MTEHGVRHPAKVSGNNFTSRLILLCLSAALWCVLPVAQANLLVPENSSFSLPDGSTFDLACGFLDVQGDLLMNSAEISQALNVDIASGALIDGGSGVLQLSGNWNNQGTFNAGDSTVVIDASCSSAPIFLSGTTVFNNLTIIGGSGRTVTLPVGSQLTVNGTLTLQGTGPDPLELVSSGGGLAVINLGPDAQVIQNNVSLAGNVRIGARSAGVVAVPSLGILSLSLLGLLMAVLGSALLPRRFSN